MKLFDRYSGEAISSLPEVVEPGRFVALSELTLNGDVVVVAGAPLCSDGRERCAIGKFVGRFIAPAVARPERRSLALRAVSMLSEQQTRLGASIISPLMPAGIADFTRLNDFEQELKRVIQAGHLDEIARRPRFSLRYDEEVMPLARVQRMAGRAVVRLAAHSEDWQKQTLSGVVPRRLLALLSEDEWAIYENVVFARLVDDLNIYLRDRLSELRELAATYEHALEIDKSEDLDFRLRESLCQIWGDSLSDAGAHLDAARSAIHDLDSMRRAIGRQLQSALYARIPRSIRVASPLQPTNILLYDSHYRHLRSLWALREKHRLAIRAPQAIHDENARQLQEQTDYVMLLAKRVMAKFGSGSDEPAQQKYVLGPDRFRLFQKDFIVILEAVEDGQRLVLVPALDAPRGDFHGAVGGDRILVNLSSGQDTDEGPNCMDVAAAFRVMHPLDMYVEEKMRSLLLMFCYERLFRRYGLQFPRLPKPVIEWFASHGVGGITGDSLQISCPLSQDQQAAFEAWLPVAPVNSETRDQLSRQVSTLVALSQCVHCGSSAATRFEPRDGRCFKADCHNCSAQLRIDLVDGKRIGRLLSGPDLAALPFHKTGAHRVEFPL